MKIRPGFSNIPHKHGFVFETKTDSSIVLLLSYEVLFISESSSSLLFPY